MKAKYYLKYIRMSLQSSYSGQKMLAHFQLGLHAGAEVLPDSLYARRLLLHLLYSLPPKVRIS